jgi:SAM-dependent methyltransferase
VNEPVSNQPEAWLHDPQEISDQGERVSHLVKDFGYYGHLSIYDFALSWCQQAVVLDVGSGAGYGAAYLAEHGARHVYGLEVSPKAVAFSQYHFQKPNLEFRAASLEQSPFAPGFFDLIYTSNVLEHVSAVPAFLRAAHSALKPTGTLLVAVPPITNDRLLYLNLVNPYHVNLWSPRQWEFVLKQFFDEVRVVLHGVGAIGADYAPGFEATHGPLTEKSFVFAPGTVADMYRLFTLTAIFVASAPRRVEAVPAATAPLRFVDDSFSRPPGYIDPRLKRKLRSYFTPPTRSLGDLVKGAGAVWRAHGMRVLIRETLNFLRRKA